MNGLSKEAAALVVVGEEGNGQRIDHFLARILKGVPRSHLYRILRSGEVRLNGRRVGPDRRLAVDDVVRVPPVQIEARGTAAPARPSAALARAHVLFEDEALLALDKPAGLAVHGGSGVSQGLIEQLRAARPEARFLELAHRLDRETSGVLLIAKKRSALVELHRMLRDGEVEKTYLALVRGRWRDARRVVRAPLRRQETRTGDRRVLVDDEGQAAVTTFRRQRVWADRDPPLSLLEAELGTGRTHQIRVHLSHLGFPIAGDDKYGDDAWNRLLRREGLKRMFLHACRVSFRHPLRGERLTIEAPLPEALARFVANLR